MSGTHRREDGMWRVGGPEGGRRGWSGSVSSGSGGWRESRRSGQVIPGV